MSSARRRRARKIRQLVRMDQTRRRMEPSSSFLVMMGADRQYNFFTSCMVPLGKRLGRMGLKDRVIAALEESGTDMRHREDRTP